jgi:hypothetical protein
MRREMPFAETLRRTAAALNAIGKLNELDEPGRHVLGTVSSWGKPVFIDVYLVPSSETATELRVETVGLTLMPDVGVARRFEDAFDNLDKPGYRADRVGPRLGFFF